MTKGSGGDQTHNRREQELRVEILDLVRQYVAAVHRPTLSKPAVPGASRMSYGGRIFDENEVLNLVESSLDFWLTYGRFCREFETRLAKTLAVSKALMVNSGSSANLLAFMALTSPDLGNKRIRRGDEVVTVAAGFPTTVTPVVQFGAVPVFVDIEPRYYNIDVRMLEKAVTSKTRAVFLAHTMGNPFDIQKVLEVCRKYDLWLIEDNCDALGSTYQDKFTGTWGDVGTSSFYPPHHITTGEGGAVYANDKQLIKILLSMRDWGRDCWCESGQDNTCGRRFSQQFGRLPFGYDHKYVYSQLGYNLKPTEMQAAVGCAQLGKLFAFKDARKANFDVLHKALKDCEATLQLPAKTPGSDPNWFGFLITVNEDAPFGRNDLVAWLESRNVQTRNLFAGDLTRHPCFSHLREGTDYRIVGQLAHTLRVMRQSFWIGLFPGLGEPEMKYMAVAIREFIGRKTKRG